LDGFGDDSIPNLIKPRILLMGLQRSGKSSILKVVFYKMSPHETLFLESTSSVEKSDIANSSFIQFQIWDFPGQIDFFSSEVNTAAIFRGCNAVIFVIDAQDDHAQALSNLHTTATKAHQVNPEIRFEVFIHKADGLQEESKVELQRALQTQILEDCHDSGAGQMHFSFFLTSIYDHSIFEAFSKVVQKLIPQMSSLECLHDTLNSSSRIEKSFLFDVVSKIYISTDASPVDMASYELCSDMIDVVIDVSCIYGMNDDGMGLAYDAKSAAIIKLSNGMVLYLRHINRFLAIVCIMREECLERQGLIDFNIGVFKDGVAKVFTSAS
jgi:Ras-related GTP-binding protein C/D